MKFIHTADIHWGAHPDSRRPWGKEREKAIKDTFINLMATAAKEGTELILIAGDLFHSQPLLRDLKEINYLFSSVPDTKIVFIAGNHDFLRNSSHYHTFAWSENVTFLAGEKPDSVYFPQWNLEVHGFSYHDAKRSNEVLKDLSHERDGRVHFLLLHGGDEEHIPLTGSKLSELDFDYIALGHIHKHAVLIPDRAAYPGSLEPINSTEFGSHGYIEGELKEGRVSIRQVPFATARYISLIVQITPETTNIELNQTLQREIENRGLEHIYRFRLQGFYDPDIVFDFQSLYDDYRITEIIDESEPCYDYQKLYKEHQADMIGLYIGSLEKPEMTPVEKKALFYGMKALMNTTSEGK